ncbi:MAG: hypothetical protein PHE25_04990 [Candidatus Gracilibacteria bacterium]|nr:hypothetical protein [Candidatus Gracilibacteria bacterium]
MSGIINNVNTLVPTGFIGTFYLSSCPVGWIPADGTNGTPDLRGEFIRGVDNGRGVDAGRTLGSFQRGSLVMNTIDKSDTRGFTLSHESNNNLLGYDNPITDSSKLYYRGDAYGIYNYHTWATNGTVDFNYVRMTRPRNIALLFCMKQ